MSAALTGCGQGQVNPPEQPAAPIQTPEAMDLAAASSAGGSSFTSGPKSFVGSWAVNPAWCERPQGERRPIVITPMRFEGYENSCDILTIDETNGGYDARLRCQSEGQTREERVRMAVSGDVLNITYPDRDGVQVKLARCPNSPDPSDEKSGLAKMVEK